MDRELETYVEQVITKQDYRSGIFFSWKQMIVNAMADFRFGADVRGSHSIRGGR